MNNHSNFPKTILFSFGLENPKLVQKILNSLIYPPPTITASSDESFNCSIIKRSNQSNSINVSKIALHKISIIISSASFLEIPKESVKVGIESVEGLHKEKI